MKILFCFLLFVAPFAHADSPQWNLRTQIFQLLGKTANLRLDYGLSDHLVVGPELSYENWKVSSLNYKGTIAVGAAAAYYFTKVFQDSWYFELGADYAEVHVEAVDTNGETNKADFNNFSVRGLGGYHWFWNTFNLSVGFGLVSDTHRKYEVKNSQGQVIGKRDLPYMAFDLSAGFTF